MAEVAKLSFEMGTTDFSAGNLNDTDLFKYFLNEEVVDLDSSGTSSPFDSPSQSVPSGNSPLNGFSSPSSPDNTDPLLPDFLAPVHVDPLLVDSALLDPLDLELADSILPIKQEQFDEKSGLVPIAPGSKDNSRKRSLAQNKAIALAQQGQSFAVASEKLSPVSSPGAPEEERQQKRQRRLIKNRESAQLSRMRKKIYIEDLERKVSGLIAENTTLKDEVLYLQSIIKQIAAGADYTTPAPASVTSAATASLIANLTIGRPKTAAVVSNNNKNVRAAGVCMLIVLFSFGLFFNASNTAVSSPFEHHRSKRAPIPEVLPAAAAAGRTLKALPEMDAAASASQREIQTLSSESKTSIPLHYPKRTATDSDNDDEMEKALTSNKKNNKKHAAPGADAAAGPFEMDKSRKRIRISSEQEEEEEIGQERANLLRLPKAEMSLVEKSAGRIVEISADDDEFDDADSISNKNPIAQVVEQQSTQNNNTSYIFCSEAQRIMPTHRDPTAPAVVALLVPSDVLDINSMLPDHDHHSSIPSLVEISCQVLNIHLWPVNINNTRNNNF